MTIGCSTLPIVREGCEMAFGHRPGLVLYQLTTCMLPKPASSYLSMYRRPRSKTDETGIGQLHLPVLPVFYPATLGRVGERSAQTITVQADITPRCPLPLAHGAWETASSIQFALMRSEANSARSSRSNSAFGHDSKSYFWFHFQFITYRVAAAQGRRIRGAL